MHTQHELEARVAAAQAVVDRFLRAPFVWGKVDCGRSIVAPILKGMGHRCPLAPFGAYSSEFGARRALKRNGFDSIADYLDQRPLLRIPPASVLIADLVGLETPGFDWLCIGASLGNGRVFAFIDVNGDGHPTGQVVQPKPEAIAAAWRVPCLAKAAP